MSRRQLLAFDEHGQDPLGSFVLDEILNIRNYTEVVVGKQYDSNPQLMAYEEYNDVELYIILLAYNGLGNSFEFVEGMRIRKPNTSEVRAILDKQQSAAVKEKRQIASRTVTI